MSYAASPSSSRAVCAGSNPAGALASQPAKFML